ncbi:hypothetical protein FHL15_003851 [Xylaria flabelliformis]|uniref:Uncharacterized protein n=1 Tax=Xylaria flabelliformis TaxID=2512241 RepID=A0A553I4M3_9PEZI|nr:hypothetical protein FHL15_003851 [Xylaria flabelliformis]
MTDNGDVDLVDLAGFSVPNNEDADLVDLAGFSVPNNEDVDLMDVDPNLYEEQYEEQPVIDDRPYSPWAARFGVWRNSDFDFWPNDPIRHSNIAPSRKCRVYFHQSEPSTALFPPLNPVRISALGIVERVGESTYPYPPPPLDPYFYGDKPNPKGHQAFSSGYDKDRLFVAEHYLKYFLLSIPPWQLGPMTHALQFSERSFVPGGHVFSLSGEAHEHRLVYEKERIKVDEDSWFPFFKKDRWFSSPGSEPYDPWSVDDPEVWGELRIALELANRILNALIKDKHVFLQTLMFGKLMYWEEARQKLFPDQPPAPFPDTTVLLSYDFYKSGFTKAFPGVPCSMDAVMNTTEEQYREQLCLLGSGQDWALASIEHANRTREGGRTYTSDRNTERVTLVASLANTILHEFTHALMASRSREDDSYLNTTVRHVIDLYKEPYVDFASQAEMGGIVGIRKPIASCVKVPLLTSNSAYGPDDILLAPHRKTWPFPDLTQSSSLGQLAQEHSAATAEVDIKLTLVPSLWFSMIMSEEFWKNDLVPRKSDNFFHAIDYFCSRNPYHPGYEDEKYKHPPIIEGDPPRTNRGIAEAIADWKLREEIWDQSRAGWFDREQDIWDKSPWGNMYAREKINEFTKQMKEPFDQRDIYICVDSANDQVSAVPWWSSREVQNPSDWVHHAIGLLMLACLPLRPEYMRREPPPPLMKTHYLIASSSKDLIRRAYQIQNENPVPLDCPPSMYWDPLGGGKEEAIVYEKGKFDHFSFLDQVLKLVQHFADNLTVVTTPWLKEILRVEEKIRTCRNNTALLLGGLDLDPTWAAEAWDFQVPEYDPDATSQWSAAMDSWWPVD